MTRRIIAIGGGGFLMERGRSLLDRYFLQATGKTRPKICFLPTASGDAEEFLAKFYSAFSKLECKPCHLAFFRKPRPGAISLEGFERELLRQDAIYVGGGNTRSMLGVWREWGVDRALRKAWQSGVLVGGMSAGAICWFQQGASDSVRGPGQSSALRCLGFLRGSCSPHFDGEPHRRRAFRALIKARELPSGIGIDDGVAVLFEDQEIAEVVTTRPGAAAYRLVRNHGGVSVRPIEARNLGSRRHRK